MILRIFLVGTFFILFKISLFNKYLKYFMMLRKDLLTCKGIVRMS